MIPFLIGSILVKVASSFSGDEAGHRVQGGEAVGPSEGAHRAPGHRRHRRRGQAAQEAQP